uniref:molybdopterin molybdotransferase MoeA n=1 Tax=Tessaracoccus timonensis TaxID=2161816 RepID=UPI000D554F7A|nr:gephyrin-like molybdotransferase Glp [Tessaracoccus timonensis]
MRSIDEHLEHVRALARELPIEEMPLALAEGRVLARGLDALVPVPPFTNSAMDGFAVRGVDVQAPTTLPVAADIPAGACEPDPLPVGAAARIMTGAPLPAGADIVVPVELTDQPRGATPLPERVRIVEAAEPGKHVRAQGENIQVGDPGVPAGTRIDAAVASSLASIGYGSVPVYARPKVAVVTTGDELASPGEPLQPGQIPDSNGLLVAGLVRRFDGEVVAVRRAGDDVAAFQQLLDEACADADVLVTTGGVSVGAFDVVRAAIDADFSPVAMQPGKPQGSGRVRLGGHDVAFLGLPGNPVSVFVSGWVFLRELLGAFSGHQEPWPSVACTVSRGWRTPNGRAQFVPVMLDGDVAEPANERVSGSHLVASLWRADGLAYVPVDVEEVTPGSTLDVYLVK